MAKRPDKALPLVIYKGGERIVIGSAYLKGDGSIEAQIAKDVKKELRDQLFGDLVGDISINPKPSAAPLKIDYTQISNTRDYSDDPAMTGRVTLPKIQES